MKRQSAGMSFKIRGDELEQHRIELEHNLQNTELSFHISSDDEHGMPRRNSSVEYPRHISEPSFAEYPSFVHRSREHSMGDGVHSPPHAWSYRTAEDEDGISPFGAETMSTVAHHASAVTISAGLGGGRAARTREPSLSGAEYDPERPLHAMITGVNNKKTMLETDLSKSKQQITFDPIVVDNTVELDRLLDSGRSHPPMRSRSVRLASPVSPGSSSTSQSTGPAQQTSRPRLTDHLRHVSFSPSRPRTAQGFNPTSPIARSSHRVAEDRNNKSMNASTPRPSRRPITQVPVPAEVRVHPPTPSTVGSKFTRMAKGITKDIEATQQILSTRPASSSSRPASAPPMEPNPFHVDPEAVTVHTRMPASRKSSLRDTTKSRIYLPDVTGLTNAVESPLRPGTNYYYPYRTDRPRDSEARLLQTLSALQSQLYELEEENSISRRRVRELEMELEECKREVVRERTRLIEREELRRSDISLRVAGSSKAKGKNKARDLSGFGRPELDDEKLRVRYKEAVEEKKALETLVTSLRSHLTRLTAELSSHQELLAELKKLREQDSLVLQEKSNEILQLREEVQRLAGEVEVLRGVVEEGLKERRASKESIQIEEDDEGVAESEKIEEQDDISQIGQEDDDAGVTQDEEGEVDELEQDTGIFETVADKTIRTDRATFGESTNSKAAAVQFVDVDDLDKIAAEVEERRSNVSNGSVASVLLRSPSPVRRPSNTNNRTTAEATVDANYRQHSLLRPAEPSISRPSPAHAAEPQDTQPGQPNREQAPIDTDPETPFPRIRGEHLERLFFSVPEHNAKTCAVCYRKRDRSYNGPSSSWTKPASRFQHEEAVREKNGGQEEGFVDEQGRRNGAGTWGRKWKGKQRDRDAPSEDGEHWRYHHIGKNQVQPQTVVARVIRELEDDFTHYKSVYVELADQYKVMDAVSDVRRRNMLARHLREVVDILEQKGNQIASLYDVLSFKDRPISESVVPDNS